MIDLHQKISIQPAWEYVDEFEFEFKDTHN